MPWRTILVMTVNPGFAAQDCLEWVDARIERVVALRADRVVTVSVDGAISAARLRRSGCGTHDW